MAFSKALGIVRKYYPDVETIADAKRGVTILVTKSDCKKANPKDPHSCAMAKAAEKSNEGAIISLSVAYLINGRKALRYKTPEAVQRELVTFDRHSDFAPGIYKLNAPTKSEQLGPRAYAQPANKGKYVDSKKRRHKTDGIRIL